MPDRQWFVASGDKQYGPYSDERLRQLIADRQVVTETFVWCQGMKDWARAGDIPGLMPATRPPAMPPRTAVPDGSAQAFSTSVGVWPLFGRLLLLYLSVIVVIPLPSVATNFFRWFVDQIELPRQQRVSFAGKIEDIRYMFICYALCAVTAAVVGIVARHQGVHVFLRLPLEWLFYPLTSFFALIITRWFYANLVWEGQSAPLRFTGGYWALLGWKLLSMASIISIIGWAWVFTAWGRWMCRNVQGANREFIFAASGLSVLWRTWLLIISCALVVPSPWAVRWYVRWLISQFELRS